MPNYTGQLCFLVIKNLLILLDRFAGSRKFGGYRIVPRACKEAVTDTSYKNDAGGGGGGVCMFNFECTQLGGSVVGSCVDVFLFGACCRLPAGARVPTVEQSSGPSSTAATVMPGRRPTGPPALPSFQQPVADTILLHRNGSAVQNTYRPDDMTADLLANLTAAAAMMHGNRWPPPSSGDMSEIVHQQQYTTSSSADGYHRRPPFSSNKVTSKIDYYGDGTSTVKQTWSSSSSPVSKSTDSVPNIRKTTPSAIHTTTTSKQGYGDEYYDSMVLIPTLTVHDPNVKTPVENNSIHHILSILNHTPPPPGNNGGDDNDDDEDRERDPMDTSPTYQSGANSSPPPSLYTWGSIDDAGDSKSPSYGATFPVTKPQQQTYYPQTQHYDRPAAITTNYYGSTPTTTPATSTHHLPGPHFHVLSTTAKPLEPVAPTVIVLSPANDSKNPNKYTTTTTTTTTSALYASSTYRPPSSHVKPSQGIIVTGKPSVSAAYTTTATYHHHQHQQQPNIAFVPVSSTTLADKYYNTNYHPTNGVVHTSAKPLVPAKPSSTYGSSHRPPVTTATSPSPPTTLSSTVHHDAGAGNNNNVFTTVITSVNHQYHNKYQPTASVANTYTTAKPVLNGGDATVAVVSSSTGGGYRPHIHQSSVDDDYPLPVVTPATQVFITASDVHHHHHLQQHTSSSAYPATGGAYDDAAAAAAPFNSTDTFAFPPVRDPNVNLTAAATQQEKPPDVAVGGDYDADVDPNPQLTADENLDDKVHLFVEKVVQSLQGNFEDLEKVLMSGDPSSSNVTVGINDEPVPVSTWPNKKPTTTTTTKKPPSKPGSKPTKPPPNKYTTTYRPSPITPPAGAPYLEITTTAKPTKVPTLLTPVQLFQPTTYTARPPTKQPVKGTPSTTVLLDTLNVDHTTAEPDYRKGSYTLNTYRYRLNQGLEPNRQ